MDFILHFRLWQAKMCEKQINNESKQFCLFVIDLKKSIGLKMSMCLFSVAFQSPRFGCQLQNCFIETHSSRVCTINVGSLKCSIYRNSFENGFFFWFIFEAELSVSDKKNKNKTKNRMKIAFDRITHLNRHIDMQRLSAFMWLSVWMCVWNVDASVLSERARHSVVDDWGERGETAAFYTVSVQLPLCSLLWRWYRTLLQSVHIMYAYKT